MTTDLLQSLALVLLGLSSLIGAMTSIALRRRVERLETK